MVAYCASFTPVAAGSIPFFFPMAVFSLPPKSTTQKMLLNELVEKPSRKYWVAQWLILKGKVNEPFSASVVAALSPVIEGL